MPADPHVVSALQDKLHDLRSAVTTYEELLERTRRELAVVTATLSLFKRSDDRPSDHRPAHVRNLFKRGEPLTICKAALAAEPEGMTTRALAVACLGAREFDHEDPVLVRAMVGVLSNTLKKAVRRGELVRAETGRREAIWQLTPPKDESPLQSRTQSPARIQAQANAPPPSPRGLLPRPAREV